MSILEKTLRGIVITGVFVLPFVALIIASSLFFPYITGKNFTFRIAVEGITAAWLALALVSPKYRPRRSWILGAFALFVFIMAIADAQGVMPFKSFWSNYERMDGWVTLIHLLLYLVVAVSVIRTEQLWRWIFQTSLAISAFISGLGLLQIAHVIDLGSGGTGLSARIDVTFGNPIYLAGYMLFSIFFAALLWAQEGKKEWGKNERIALGLVLFISAILVAPQVPASHLLYLVLAYIVTLGIMEGLMLLPRWAVLLFIIVIDTLALLFTGTRGTTLGLVGGAGLALVVYALTPAASRWLRQITVGVVIFVMACAGGLWLARDTAFVHSVGFLDRLASISFTDTTIKSRLINMSIAWNGVKERPILGWGQENYAIVFDKYYDPRMYADEPWFDRVHNVIFDWWVTGGTLGLVSYLSILVLAVAALWRSKEFSFAERAILTGLIAGYFVHDLAVFDNITSYIPFLTVLAYIVWRSSASKPILFEKPRMPEAALPFAAAIGVIVFFAGAWFVNGDAFIENRLLIEALSQQPSLSTNLALFEQAASYGTYGTQEVREQLIQAATQVAQASGADPAIKQQFFQVATQQMQLQEKASPLDARFPLFLGVLDDAYGDYTDAAVNLERAHQLSPGKQSMLFQIGLNDEAQQNYSAALAAFKQAYELDTNDIDALLFYASGAIYDKQDALAQQLLAPYIPTGQAADQRILSAYASRGLYSKLVPIWQAAVKAQPQNEQSYFTLAAIYYQMGNHASAIATLQQAASAIPAAQQQADSLIQQIQSGTVQTQAPTP